MRAAQTDANQSEIVKALRQCGVSVQSLHRVGEGVPDLLCGYHGLNKLIEVKDGDRPPSERKLNDKQKIWHDEWKGQRAVANSVDEALKIMGVL